MAEITEKQNIAVGKKNDGAVPKRILASLLNSISAGVVPRSGAPYIAIGRTDEISALMSDLELVADGGASMRFIIGRYGSGKSFLIQLVRGYALERGFLTCDADLSPERRICGAKGTGIATYRELIKNLSCKSSPDGGAMQIIISKWLSSIQSELAASGMTPGSADFLSEVKKRIYAVAHELEDHVGGFDFASVIVAYYEAIISDDDEKKSDCLRWLRGEYTTKTEAKSRLPVSDIIGDENWHDMIKLLAVFATKTGYKGLCVFIDECVNLYKISNRISRENNYEKLLSMFNDTLQGRAPGLALIFGGTPQFLEDTRRGLFSYEALRSRLCDSKFDTGYKNMLSPVIRLKRLSDNELLALVTRVTKLHAQYYNWNPPITPEDSVTFLKICLSRAGADSMITPREILRDYLSVLGILMQNPDTDFAAVVGKTTEESMNTNENTAKNSDNNDLQSDDSAHQKFSLDDIDI